MNFIRFFPKKELERLTNLNFLTENLFLACRFLILEDAQNGNDELTDEKKMYFPCCAYDRESGNTWGSGLKKCKILTLAASPRGTLPLFFIINTFNQGMVPCESWELSFREIQFPVSQCFLEGCKFKEKELPNRTDLVCVRCEEILAYRFTDNK